MVIMSKYYKKLNVNDLNDVVSAEKPEAKYKGTAGGIRKKPNIGLKAFRIVVRNLPFNTTQDEFRDIFSKFGTVKEIQLPKCKDKKYPNSIAGFGFVQFGAREAARNAVKELNFTQFKDRKIAVDWALHKDDYMSKKIGSTEHANLMKVARSFDDKNVDEDDDAESDKSGSDSEEDLEEIESDENENMDMRDKDDLPMHDDSIDGMGKRGKTDEDQSKKRNRKDDAVDEGRVVFLRNLSFDATNETVKTCMEQFGEVSLAILCKFPGTDQKSGNAFVHFQSKEAADKCLEELDVSGIFFEGRIIEGHRAVPRDEAKKFESDSKKKEGKDKRNLKLLRASLVRMGTAQAKEMSEEDAKFRQKLIETAKTKLKNLHMFVSPTRLAVHNIPFKYRDDDLFNLCLKYATKNCYIKECRIMRNKTGVDQQGKPILGRSKGFGFVEFDSHLDALTCLRNLNNNPEVFTDERRPIAEFSIENLNALRIKENRKQLQQEGYGRENEELKSRKEAMLRKSKATIVKDGMKVLPKKFGQKVRHREKKNFQNKNKTSGSKKGIKITRLGKGKVTKRRK